MQHAQKMILVPQTATNDSLTDMDKEMQDILSRKDLDDHTKWRLYKESLHRFKYFKGMANQPRELNVFDSNWTSSIPAKFKIKAESLLNDLDPSRISIDRQGAVTIDNVHYPHSNITKLVYAAVNTSLKTRPIAFDVFSQLVNQTPKVKSPASLVALTSLSKQLTSNYLTPKLTPKRTRSRKWLPY